MISKNIIIFDYNYIDKINFFINLLFILSFGIFLAFGVVFLFKGKMETIPFTKNPEFKDTID